VMDKIRSVPHVLEVTQLSFSSIEASS
jgi:hypothetical protein